LMDDVLLYPTEATVIPYSYNEVGNVLSETKNNGRTVFYEYDKLGRLRYVRDWDKNILKKESYMSYNTTLSLATPTFRTLSSQLEDGVDIPFEVGPENRCLLGVTYNWDFGDGTTIVTNNPNPTHIFTNPGTYQVKVVATHTSLGTKSYTSAVTIALRPLNVVICASGVLMVDNCGINSPTIGACAGISTPNNRTDVNIVSVTGCNGTLSYQWERSDIEGEWTVVGTGTQYSRNVNLNYAQPSYKIRLKVTSSCGRTGVSSVFEFVGYKSKSNCVEKLPEPI